MSFLALKAFVLLQKRGKKIIVYRNQMIILIGVYIKKYIKIIATCFFISVFNLHIIIYIKV